MATHNKRTGGYVMLSSLSFDSTQASFINLVRGRETIFEDIGGLYKDSEGYVVYDEQHDADTFDFRSYQYKLVYPEDFGMNEYLAWFNFKD